MKITPLRVIPRISSTRQLIRRCDDYFLNKWYTSARYGTDVYIPFDEIWGFEGSDRSWRFQHHSLASVSHLVDGFIETKESRYLDLAKKIIFNWFEVNFPESPSDMGWHDHSTAWRLINICRFYVEWKESADISHHEYTLLEEIVQAHEEKLADADFYMPKHNHGLEQDMALFTGSVIFDSLPKSKEWEHLSLKRFQEQLSHLFGEDGSYFEHSPHYVYLLLKSLYTFLDFIYQINHSSAEDLTRRLEKTFKFLIYMIQPDGVIPSIGDSENAIVQMKIVQNWKLGSTDLLVFLEKLLSDPAGLEQNESVLPLDAAFLDGGFVQVRNKWDFDNETTQIIMYSGFHSRVHKHYDDLSFVLFHQKKPLITEGGKYSYDYQSPGREYVVSPYAHNSVMVDEKPAEIFAKNFEKSGVLSVLLTKNISYVSGMHALYPGINHRRIFIYFKPSVLVVIDILKGLETHIFDTFFNLHWELDCILEEEAFFGYLNGEKVIKIENIFAEEHQPKLSLIKGETEPLKGWLSPEYGKIVPNPLIQFRANGEVARNIYQISLGKSLHIGEKVETFWNENHIQLKWKSYKIDIHLTDFYEHLYIKGKYYRTNKIVKPELIEGITKNESMQYQRRSET